MRQMMSLSGFVFSLSKGFPYKGFPYKGLLRTSDSGWVAVARYGQKPMSQNTGQQLENITVTGTWFQGDGMANLNALRALQNQRAPLVLADGYGNNLGQWTIKRLQEKQDKIVVSLPSQNTPSEGQFINCQLDRPSRSAIAGVKAN